MNRFVIYAAACLSLLATIGCSSYSTSRYRGDGRITAHQSWAGVASTIRFGRIDVRANTRVEYSMAGLPPGQMYPVLFVPDGPSASAPPTVLIVIRDETGAEIFRAESSQASRLIFEEGSDGPQFRFPSVSFQTTPNGAYRLEAILNPPPGTDRMQLELAVCGGTALAL